ncbi:hypothetical protein Vadar_004993 [Vaccinium darrowii]|uniref:Uncharacterized protein n=1 Tax=Vaccinium darrowii TaxID=229202 RepID=A0ACB7Y6J9_9ERIC|nr:hypothetical protein Vadar_004993 [Vaccinium darrowii]
MVRERQTASNRWCKASEVTQTRKGKRVRRTDALPQEQPPHVEGVEADTEAEAENQEQEVPSRDGPSSDVDVGDAENVPRGGGGGGGGNAVHIKEDDRDLVTLLQECLGISQTEVRAVLNGGKSVGLTWLKENFMTVKSTDSDERVGYYLEKVGTYAWGTEGLAYLCRQLGTTSRRGVRQMCGYTTLLEAWIHEHFPTLQQPENPNYTEDLPRAHRWLPRREAGNVSVSHYRRMLDDLHADQVIFDPYKARRGDVPPIVFYTGPIRGMSIVEPYLPDRVVSPDAGAGEVNTGGSDGMKLAAIAAEVDKVYADKLSPFNMRQALRNISKKLRRNTEGEPTTPFTIESYTRCH